MRRSFGNMILGRPAILLLSVFMILAILPAAASREQARGKACAANMRVIAGAIEMYNMDHEVPLRELNAVTLKGLVRDSYLKTHPTPPDIGCMYEGRDLDRVSNLVSAIRCPVHGTAADVQKFYDERQQVAKLRQIIIFGTVAMALLIILGTIFWGRHPRRKEAEPPSETGSAA